MRKGFKKSICTLLALSLTLGCVNSTSNIVDAKSKVKLSSTKVNMTVNQKKSISLKGIKGKKVKWSTSSKKVVAIKTSGKNKQKCILTAKKSGNATIKAKYRGKTYKCKVVVKAKKAKTSKTTIPTKAPISNPSTPSSVVTSKPTTKPSAKPTNTPNNEATASPIVTDEPTASPSNTPDATNEPTASPSNTPDATSTPSVEPTSTPDVTNTPEPTIIPEHDCEWDEGVITKEPTCVDSGELTRTCSICGKTDKETLEPTGVHVYDEGVVTKEPECKKDGVKTFKCKYCNETKEEKIKGLEHVWSEDYKVYREPTYSTYGEERKYCVLCDEFDTSSKSDYNKIPCNKVISEVQRDYYSMDDSANISILNPLFVRLRSDESSFDMEEVRFKSGEDVRYIKVTMIDYFNTFIDFTIYDENREVLETKRYSMNYLFSIFTEANKKRLLNKIYKSVEALYVEPQYKYGSSLIGAISYPPEGVPLVRNDTKETLKTPANSYYINFFGLAAICDDMGYPCQGGFRAKYLYRML